MISSVKELTDFLSLNRRREEGDRETINVQQIETFMKNEGFQDTQAILPNFEPQKSFTTRRPKVTTAKLSLQAQPQEVESQFINPVKKTDSRPEVPENSPVIPTFSFSTLPV